jgi:hypothetical protein
MDNPFSSQLSVLSETPTANLIVSAANSVLNYSQETDKEKKIRLP